MKTFEAVETGRRAQDVVLYNVLVDGVIALSNVDYNVANHWIASRITQDDVVLSGGQFHQSAYAFHAWRSRIQAWDSGIRFDV